MATIKVLNNPAVSGEEPIEIHLSLSNPTYRGPAGKDGENGRTPIKGVDYFTEADIQNIVEQIVPPEIDLSDYAHKDEIPTKVSDLTNDEGFISSYTETDPTVPAWAKQPTKPTYTASEVGALPDSTVIPTVPTNVSAFVNDAGYLTSHQSLTDYATKNYVEQVVAGVETGLLKRSVVASLPSISIDENTIYMVERTNSETNNVYDEYLYLNNSWEKIGSTEVDLTDYLKKTDLTFTNGLTSTSGIVSWNLNDRIYAGSGRQAVCEGVSTLAVGNYSHAEGNNAQAWGGSSHAEGIATKAGGVGQHAQGKYNVEDYNDVFADIVGNGSYQTHSNAMALDWSGNEYLSGNLYVGCNAYSTTSAGLITTNAGGSKVATESYVNTAFSTNIEYLTNSEILAIWNGENN